MFSPTAGTSFSRPSVDPHRWRTSRGLIALATFLFLVPALLAQEPGNGQYAPDQSGDQQSGYGQPEYAQPQHYGQQSNPQQAYPEQSAPAQPYSEDGQPEGPIDPQQGPQRGYGQEQPLNAQDLEQLVAPIALYPDAMVAQVLTAATYPEQVAGADRWRRAQGYAPSDQIAAGANAQPWDPSVKALTAYPQVLAQMDQNLHWTSELGNAYYNQPRDVLQAVQVLRQRAQAAGNLQSTPQEAVSYDQGNIVLAPVNPQVVYVPTYNPWAIYGPPIAPYPGFSLLGAVGSFIGSAFGPVGVRFGLGIAMTAFTHTPFGLLAWGLDWLAHSVLFHGSNYFSHSITVTDWGLPHGGPRAFGRGQGVVGWSNRSYRPRGGDRAFAGNRLEERDSRNFQRSATGYGRTSQQAYNRFQPSVARPEQYRSQQNRSQPYSRSVYGSSSYGSSSYNRSAENYGSKAGAGFGKSTRVNRAPSSNFQRSTFGSRSSRGFKGNSFAESSGKRSHSGSSHFGGHAPKGYSGGKSFGHSHSGGGGHSGGHSHSGGGKHHH